MAAAVESKAGQRTKLVSRIGTVVSDKRQKTIKVVYSYTVKHAKYGKYFKRSTTLQTHDENNEARVGDVVEVFACRPMSKTKSWRLGRIVSRASQQ
jgi:small subunit ribosomal protein S17